MRFEPDELHEKVPMDPEDHRALLAWVKAKETGAGDCLQRRSER